MNTALKTPRRRLLASEITKLVGLRSVWVTALVVTIIAVVGAWSQAGVIGEAIRTSDPDLAPGVTPESVGFEWVALGLIGILVIGVVAASSEYTSGQITTSVVAVPARTSLFLSKIAALTIVITVMGTIIVPLVSVLSQRGLGDLTVINGQIPASLLWRWVGAVVYWDAMALFAFSIATLLRQTLIPLFFLIVVSQLSLLLLFATTACIYLPTIAGVLLFDPAMVTGSYPDADVGIPVAAAVTAGWTVVVLGWAGYRFVRRDA